MVGLTNAVDLQLASQMTECFDQSLVVHLGENIYIGIPLLEKCISTLLQEETSSQYQTEHSSSNSARPSHPTARAHPAPCCSRDQRSPVRAPCR